MDKKLIKAFLEAFAVGDAYGKVTEYCSKDEVEMAYSRIDEILTPEESLAHKDLSYGRVTDDTEQNIYLIREYSQKQEINASDTAECLIRWMKETESAKYIGPSSLNALTKIEEGYNPEKSGMNGTTCGGIMRTPAAFIFSNEENLERNVVECLKPTHFTSVAIQAAMAYAYALLSASKHEPMTTILNQACKGARRGKTCGNQIRTCGVSPSIEARIKYLSTVIPKLKDEKEVKEFLYDILGATLASYDVASSVFGLFIYCKTDVKLAIRLATEMGGDSDTIASLAAGLCTIYAGGHNINISQVKLVEEANKLDFNKITQEIKT